MKNLFQIVRDWMRRRYGIAATSIVALSGALLFASPIWAQAPVGNAPMGTWNVSGGTLNPSNSTATACTLLTNFIGKVHLYIQTTPTNMAVIQTCSLVNSNTATTVLKFPSSLTNNLEITSNLGDIFFILEGSGGSTGGLGSVAYQFRW